MGELIKKLEQNFDFIFFDTPPAGIVTDPVLMTKWIKKVIIIVRYSKSKTNSLDETLARLAHVEADVLGLIMNCAADPKRYSYYKNKYVYF